VLLITQVAALHAVTGTAAVDPALHVVLQLAPQALTMLSDTQVVSPIAAPDIALRSTVALA